MTTPTVHRLTDRQPEVHGPAEVRAALIGHATEQTLAVYDRDIDEATRESAAAGDVAPLLRRLEHWWMCAQLAAGEVPADFHPIPGTGAQASWEAKNGRPLYDAA